jgi:hypothetical protein
VQNAGDRLKRQDRALRAAKPAPLQTPLRPVTFFVIFESRRRRCIVSHGALELLAGHELVTPKDHRRAFVRHRAWLQILAAIELAERRSSGVLRLENAHVAFQLACEAADLPDVLCF